jgi:tRNA nucleotidyltransferase (CCA-adding enzyme)
LERLPERVAEVPGGAELCALAPPGTWLVGGAVRDLLLGRAPRELDVVVVDPAPPYARAGAELAAALAARLGTAARASEHERFGTVLVECGSARIDVAAARRERYAAPGALPEVEAAGIEQDLERRDFTVNALAVALDGARPARWVAAPHALEDLAAGRLRVLHERSFRDDPTRLWRMARYRARLGFAVEQQTARLAAEAVAEGAPATVSGARLGAELRLALREPDAPAALAELERLGLLRALHPRLRFEEPLARAALALLADGATRGDHPDELLLALVTLPLALRAQDERDVEIRALLDRLEFAAGARDRVATCAVAAPALVEQLPAARAPSELRALAARLPPEAIALAGALSEAAADAARRWLGELRHVRLRIDGADLLAGGLEQGPEIGRRLERTLARRLDGELPDEREAQLRAALAG